MERQKRVLLPSIVLGLILVHSITLVASTTDFVGTPEELKRIEEIFKRRHQQTVLRRQAMPLPATDLAEEASGMSSKSKLSKIAKAGLQPAPALDPDAEDLSKPESDYGIVKAGDDDAEREGGVVIAEKPKGSLEKIDEESNDTTADEAEVSADKDTEKKGDEEKLPRDADKAVEKPTVGSGKETEKSGDAAAESEKAADEAADVKTDDAAGDAEKDSTETGKAVDEPKKAVDEPEKALEEPVKADGDGLEKTADAEMENGAQQAEKGALPKKGGIPPAKKGNAWQKNNVLLGKADMMASAAMKMMKDKKEAETESKSAGAEALSEFHDGTAETVEGVKNSLLWDKPERELQVIIDSPNKEELQECNDSYNLKQVPAELRSDNCKYIETQYRAKKSYTYYGNCVCHACGGTVKYDGNKNAICTDVAVEDPKKRLPKQSGDEDINECNFGVGKDLPSKNLYGVMLDKCEDVKGLRWKREETQADYYQCLCKACEGQLDVTDTKGRIECKVEHKFRKKEVNTIVGEGKPAESNATTPQQTIDQCNDSNAMKRLVEKHRGDRKLKDCTAAAKTWVWQDPDFSKPRDGTQYYRCACKACGGTIMLDDAGNEFCKDHQFGMFGAQKKGNQMVPKKTKAAGAKIMDKSMMYKSKCVFDKELSKFLKTERTQAQIMSSQGFVNNFIKMKELRQTYPMPDSEPPELMKGIKDDEEVYFVAFKHATSVDKLRRKLLGVQRDEGFPVNDFDRCTEFENYLETTSLRHIAGGLVDSHAKERIFRKSSSNAVQPLLRYSEKPIFTLTNSVKMHANRLYSSGGKWDMLSMAVKRAHMVVVHEIAFWVSIYKYLKEPKPVEEKKGLDATMLPFEFRLYPNNIFDAVETNEWIRYLRYTQVWKEEDVLNVEDKLRSKTGYSIGDGVNFGNEQLALKLGMVLDTTDLNAERERMEKELEDLKQEKTEIPDADTEAREKIAEKEARIHNRMKTVEETNKIFKESTLKVGQIQRSAEKAIQESVEKIERKEHGDMNTVIKAAADDARDTLNSGMDAFPGSDFTLERVVEMKPEAVELSYDIGKPMEDVLTNTKAVKTAIEQEKKERKDKAEALERQAEMANKMGSEMLLDTADDTDGDAAAVDDSASDNSSEADDSAEASVADAVGNDSDGQSSPNEDEDPADEDPLNKIEHSELSKARREYDEKMGEFAVDFEAVAMTAPELLRIYDDMLHWKDGDDQSKEPICKDTIAELLGQLNKQLLKVVLPDDSRFMFEMGSDSQSTIDNLKTAFNKMKEEFNDIVQRALTAHHKLYQKLISDPSLDYKELNDNYQGQYLDPVMRIVGNQKRAIADARRELADAVHDAADVVTDYISTQNDVTQKDEGEKPSGVAGKLVKKLKKTQKKMTEEKGLNTDFWRKVYEVNIALEDQDLATYVNGSNAGFNHVHKYVTFRHITPKITMEQINYQLSKIMCPIGFSRVVVIVVQRLLDTMEKVYEEACQAGINELPNDLPDRPVKVDNSDEERQIQRKLAMYNNLMELASPNSHMDSAQFGSRVQEDMEELAAAGDTEGLQDLAGTVKTILQDIPKGKKIIKGSA